MLIVSSKSCSSTNFKSADLTSESKTVGSFVFFWKWDNCQQKTSYDLFFFTSCSFSSSFPGSNFPTFAAMAPVLKNSIFGPFLGRPRNSSRLSSSLAISKSAKSPLKVSSLNICGGRTFLWPSLFFPFFLIKSLCSSLPGAEMSIHWKSIFFVFRTETILCCSLEI